jgi:hypothetical protein
MYHAQVNLYFLVLLLVFRNERTTKRKEKENKNFHTNVLQISNALRFT